MADIKKYMAKDGSVRYGMELPGVVKKSIRTFPTLEEAVAFAEGPASAQVPYKRSFAAAHAAIQRAAQPRRERRTALLGLAIETCARMREIYFSEWADIDLDRRVWMIPGTYSRGGLSRTVPLTKKAQSIFRELMSSGQQGRSRVFENLGSITGIATDFPLLMDAMGLPYANFTELRHDAAIRMQKRQTMLCASELSKILDRPLPAPYLSKHSKKTVPSAVGIDSKVEDAVGSGEEARPPSSDSMIMPCGGGSNGTTTAAHSNARLHASSRELRRQAREQFFELALETGANRRELVLAEWCQLDLDKRIWTIPRSHARRGVGRCTPLTKRAVQILSDLWDRRYEEHGRIFPILLGGYCRPEEFSEAMQTLGLACESYFDLRRVARQRFEAAHPLFSRHDCCAMLGYRS